MAAEIPETQGKILLTAGKLFSQNGFNGVTHRELAREAGVNSALINYYFRSKELLFEQVLDYSYSLTQAKYPIPLTEEMDPFAGILAIVRRRLLPVFDDGPEGWFPRIVHHEMHAFTPQKEIIRKRYFQPIRQKLTSLVAQYLKQDETSITVKTAVFNISSQWIMMNVSRSRGRGLFKEGKLTNEEKEVIINRVVDFIKGGLQQVGKRK